MKVNIVHKGRDDLDLGMLKHAQGDGDFVTFPARRLTFACQNGVHQCHRESACERPLSDGDTVQKELFSDH